jgi:EGF-like domain
MCQNTRANVPGTLRKRDCIVQGNRDKACMKQADMPSPVPMITGSGLPSTSSPTFVARQAGSSNATACPLSCQNGGNCDSDLALGEPTCICPPGFTGDLCEIIKEQRCGQDTCYHGSECVAASNGGLFCDCSTIGDPVRHYAGKFCQFETTLYCPNPNYFCHNRGRCKPEGLG